jgi:hypothetical protein
MIQLSGLHLEIEILVLWLSFHLHTVIGQEYSRLVLTAGKFKVTIHFMKYKTEKKKYFLSSGVFNTFITWLEILHTIPTVQQFCQIIF